MQTHKMFKTFHMKTQNENFPPEQVEKKNTNTQKERNINKNV